MGGVTRQGPPLLSQTEANCLEVLLGLAVPDKTTTFTLLLFSDSLMKLPKLISLSFKSMLKMFSLYIG
jgi:hypothetical protein